MLILHKLDINPLTVKFYDRKENDLLIFLFSDYEYFKLIYFFKILII